MRKIRMPSDALIVALTEVGLRHRTSKTKGITQFADFCVTGLHRCGERYGTLAVVYSRHARAIVVESAAQIERRTRELDYPFHVRTYTIVGKVVHTVVDVSNT